ncbi:MAG: choice-of-anchor E domain-containing protein [Phycisphaerales bacterium]|nr:choice-of-anchor E domain-containing protein [Phycisphaerales bacterium]
MIGKRVAMPLLAALSVCLCAAGALAGSVQYDRFTGRTSMPEEPNEVEVSVSVPKFNPTTGVLQSVTISAELKFDGFKGLENLDPNLSTGFRLNLLWNFDLRRPDLSSLLHIDAEDITGGRLNPFDGAVDFGGGSGISRHPATFESGMTKLVSPTDLALFTGVGDIELLATGGYVGTVLVFSIPVEETMSRFEGAFEANISVTYDFVPEPSAVALFALILTTLVRRAARVTAARTCHANH